MSNLYNAPVTRIARDGEFVDLTIRCPELARAAKPGQFLHIRCGHSRVLRRPISICDTEDGCLRMVFQVKGSGTQWLAERTVGQALDVLGPLGNGYDLPQGRVLVAGGGIGVPPMLKTAKAATAADAVLGYRSAAQAILLTEFQDACGTVKVMTDDGSLGDRGFVADGVRAMLASQHYDAVLACGPKIMLKTTAQAAAEAGVPCWVSLEERMGCGIGACLVCACKTKKDGQEQYSHVCKNGPVFSAEEVVWDD
jgi:dihydroorotate dehydrogenase electron transfer subunit